MVTPFLAGLYTAVFAATALYFSWRGVRARAYAVEFTEHLLHVVMSAVMVAMVWPWWDHLPRVLLLIFFAAATAWFLLMMVLQAAGIAAAGRHGRLGLWYRSLHAVMMAAMVWMIAVMPDHHHRGHGLSRAAHTAGSVLVALMLVLGVIELIAFMRRTADSPAAAARVEAPTPHNLRIQLVHNKTINNDSIVKDSIYDNYSNKQPVIVLAHPDSFVPEHAYAESVGVLAMVLGMAAMCASLL